MQAQATRRSRRIGAPLLRRFAAAPRKAWRFLVTRILGRDFRFRLMPVRDLQPLGGDDWLSVGHDPYFELVPLEGWYPCGWVRICSRLQRESEDRTLKLYYDAGAGLSERTSIRVPVGRSGEVDELVRLPRGVRLLRWDPMQWRGELRQSPVVISRVGPIERRVRMLLHLRRLMREQPAARLEEAGLDWRRALLDTHGAYRAAAGLRDYLPKPDYAQWIEAQDRLADADRAAIRAQIRAFRQQPLVSLLMPLRETPAGHLRAALDSVCAQLYERWELCVAGDAPAGTEARAILEEYARREPRIRLALRPAGGNFAAASNAALEAARGELVALLDPADMLAEHALYHVVREIEEHADTDVVYSDEDRIDARGLRSEPRFKSGWNPDLLLSHDYVSRLCVYRAPLVRAAGAWRAGFEGSEDYDLLLRCAGAPAPPRIRHIPAVLYHRRVGAAAQDEASVAALREHLRTGSPGAAVEPGRHPGTCRVRYPLPNPEPAVSLIVPTRDRGELLRSCVGSLLEKTAYANFEVLVVDNQSTEEAALRCLDELARDGRVRVLRYDRPFNFSALNNFAAREARGELIGLVNNDIEVISPGWLAEMVSHAVRPGIGAVGAMLRYGDGSIQHAGVILGLGGVAGHGHKHYPGDAPGYCLRLQLVQNLSAVTAACLLVRRQTYEQAGGFDERLAIAFNDVDFCLRVGDAGLRNLWTPYAELFHHESASRGAEDTPQRQERFLQEIRYMIGRWGARLMNDPYYHRMLTLYRDDYLPNFAQAAWKPWLRAGGGRR